MEKQNINVDEILTVGAELISDTPPKTTAGKILRWVKKIIRIKSMLNVKVK